VELRVGEGEKEAVGNGEEVGVGDSVKVDEGVVDAAWVIWRVDSASARDLVGELRGSSWMGPKGVGVDARASTAGEEVPAS
jgi:hypothetical protein